MPKSQLEQRRQGASPRRILGVLVAITVVFLLLASVIGLAEKYRAIRHRVRELKQEQVRLDQKKEQLEETNRYIQTKEGQERELRSKYNVIKPGEGVVVVTTPAEDNGKKEYTSKIGQWWDRLLRGVGVRK